MTFIEREMKVVQVLFDRAVAPYLQDRRERLQFIDPWNGSPRWVRERDALNKLWSEQTAPARKLMAVTEREILEFGEMTEATAEAWDALMPPKAPGIVPEQKKFIAQGNHSDRAFRYETETAIEGVM